MTPKLSIELPERFPDDVPPPKFQLGDRVLLVPDFGMVTGIEYALAEHLENWGWRYIIQLDKQSPSYRWIHSDLAWEDDLLLLTLGSDRILENQPV